MSVSSEAQLGCELLQLLPNSTIRSGKIEIPMLTRTT
jgi:hypothetical protein